MTSPELRRAIAYRNGGHVKRYHVVSTLGQETVAEHAFGVANLIIGFTGGTPSSALLRAALYHDLAEQHTGDIPGPVKRRDPQVKTAVEAAESAFLSHHSLAIPLSPEEQSLLNCADALDLLWYCLDQRRYGNHHIEPVFHRGTEQTLGVLKDCTNAVVHEVFHYLRGEWQALTGQPLGDLYAQRE